MLVAGRSLSEGDRPQAISLLNDDLRVYPEHPRLLAAVIRIYLDVGNVDIAQQLSQRLTASLLNSHKVESVDALRSLVLSSPPPSSDSATFVSPGGMIAIIPEVGVDVSAVDAYELIQLHRFIQT